MSTGRSRLDGLREALDTVRHSARSFPGATEAMALQAVERDLLVKIRHAEKENGSREPS